MFVVKYCVSFAHLFIATFTRCALPSFRNESERMKNFDLTDDMKMSSRPRDIFALTTALVLLCRADSCLLVPRSLALLAKEQQSSTSALRARSKLHSTPSRSRFSPLRKRLTSTERPSSFVATFSSPCFRRARKSLNFGLVFKCLFNRLMIAFSRLKSSGERLTIPESGVYF